MLTFSSSKKDYLNALPRPYNNLQLFLGGVGGARVGGWWVVIFSRVLRCILVVTPRWLGHEVAKTDRCMADTRRATFSLVAHAL